MNPNDRATPAKVLGAYGKCAWCGRRILSTEFDRHHWMVKRGRKSTRNFKKIDVVINVVPVHHECHMNHGQSIEMYDRCRAMVIAKFGADTVEQWRDRWI